MNLLAKLVRTECLECCLENHSEARSELSGKDLCDQLRKQSIMPKMHKSRNISISLLFTNIELNFHFQPRGSNRVQVYLPAKTKNWTQYMEIHASKHGESGKEEQ